MSTGETRDPRILENIERDVFILDPTPYRRAPEDPLPLGINFRQLRKNLQLSQQDVAGLLGVSRITYMKYEADPDGMPIRTYKRLIGELDRLSGIEDPA